MLTVTVKTKGRAPYDFGLCRKFCTRAKRRGRTSEIYAARA